MPQNPQYLKYHPKWYRARIPTLWWVRNWAYLRFMLRELTSVFVGFYALVCLFQIRALIQGPEAYEIFTAWLKTPVSIALHIVAFLFVVFHSVTWFNLTPKALVLHLGRKRVPGTLIVVLNYIAWGVFSTVIVWLMLTT